MRNRYYDAGQGRFIQMDPIGYEANDVNFYRYVANNVFNSIDPDGFEKVHMCVMSRPLAGHPRLYDQEILGKKVARHHHIFVFSMDGELIDNYGKGPLHAGEDEGPGVVFTETDIDVISSYRDWELYQVVDYDRGSAPKPGVKNAEAYGSSKYVFGHKQYIRREENWNKGNCQGWARYQFFKYTTSGGADGFYMRPGYE